MCGMSRVPRWRALALSPPGALVVWMDEMRCAVATAYLHRRYGVALSGERITMRYSTCAGRIGTSSSSQRQETTRESGQALTWRVR